MTFAKIIIFLFMFWRLILYSKIQLIKLCYFGLSRLFYGLPFSNPITILKFKRFLCGMFVCCFSSWLIQHLKNGELNYEIFCQVYDYSSQSFTPPQGIINRLYFHGICNANNEFSLGRRKLLLLLLLLYLLLLSDCCCCLLPPFCYC